MSGVSPTPPARTLELRPDLDQFPMLAFEREALWTQLDKATFLTTDEKRTAAGYSPKPAA